jgi:ribonuclease D
MGGHRVVQYDYIADQRQLEDLCAALTAAPVIALDTEFVSEDAYRPELCLVQVAGAGRLAVLDPQTIESLQPFWSLLASGGHQTIVHAGRQEFQFCLEATGEWPSGWFDVQIAAGFAGLEYPAAYGTLISKLLGRTVPKGETRTNWRRRPLSTRQLDYAVQDVAYLEPIRDVLCERIEKLGRSAWLAEELESWQAQMSSLERSAAWRRVAGTSGLSPRQLAIVRELWQWREEQAQERNCPSRRVLRDDLIVELARRRTDDLSRIRAIRGLERRDLQRHMPALAACIRRACALESSDCPDPTRAPNWNSAQLQLLGQFLATALGSLCRAMEIAPSLVGTTQDLRDLVAYRLNLGAANNQAVPVLSRGWRAEVIGQTIDELLAGRIAVSVHDPLADNPLQLEPREPRI